MGFLTNVSQVFQLKTNLYSDDKLAKSGRETVTFDRAKEDKQWNKFMKAVIKYDAQPLYVVDPVN